jgi:hypothetical protein
MFTSCFRQETSGSNVVLYMLLKQGKEFNYYLISDVLFPERVTTYGCHSCDFVGLSCRSGFTTLPPMLLQEQPVVLLLLERGSVSWSLAMDECSGHQDLRGSGHQSVIPTSMGELSCIPQACPA